VGLGGDSGLLVAVDGGNSKTDVAVVSTTGQVLSVVRGPGSSPHALGVDRSLDAIESLTAAALDQAGADSSDVVHVGVYLAGVDFARERRDIAGAIAQRDWPARVTVDNDTFALLRTGTSRPGVAIVCGAGVNCVAVDAAGETVRFPSLGRLSGDWGGGVRLSEEVMAAAARDEDGRDRATALTDAVRAHFGTSTVVEAIERIYFGEIESAALHGLNPLLFSIAEDGDPVAGEIVAQMADEIAAMATAAIRRLGMTVAGTPIVLGGGVLAARHPMLSTRVEARIAEAGEGAEFIYVTGRPILGAALLGLERVGSMLDPDAVGLLRSELARHDPSERVTR
jgi:N-acetylglucosamine kinase-like BadF-type ATPase